jgi:hypothetical protein
LTNKKALTAGIRDQINEANSQTNDGNITWIMVDVDSCGKEDAPKEKGPGD